MNTVRTDATLISLLVILSAFGMLGVPLYDAESTILETPQIDTTVPMVEEIAPTILPETRVPAPHAVLAQSSLPDFAAIRDVRTKKREFFDFMLPMIRQSNLAVLNDRAFLVEVRHSLLLGAEPEPAVLEKIGGISRRYRVNPGGGLLNQLDELLLKVDVVPESLVLAQAANESGWGTSRFARQANNLFGVWCFKPGCGLTPLSRDEGLTHEVAKYASVQHSVSAYVHTINTNPAYIGLRQIRANSRMAEGSLTGLALAEGLEKYSSRGMDYVREIQQMIRVNNLHEFNLPV